MLVNKETGEKKREVSASSLKTGDVVLVRNDLFDVEPSTQNQKDTPQEIVNFMGGRLFFNSYLLGQLNNKFRLFPKMTTYIYCTLMEKGNLPD